jgi:6-phosphogluconolactonase/glucosamine-6-phosphate isomerase/deaminase
MNRLLIYSDPMDLAHKATEWLQSKTEIHQARSVYLPAGRSPEPIYQYWSEKHPPFLKSLTFCQIDEIETGGQKGAFRQFFETRLPAYKDQFLWVTEGEKQADIAVLGFGVNGHVAFHEPSVSPDLRWGDVILSRETREYLNLEEGAIGKTYGLKAFINTKAVLLIVAGLQKKAMFERFMKDDPTLPVTQLKKHRELTVMVESRLLEP